MKTAVITIIQIALWILPCCIGLAMILRRRESYEESYRVSTLRETGISFEKYRNIFRGFGVFLIIIGFLIFYWIHIWENIPDMDDDFWKQIENNKDSGTLLKSALILGAIAIPARMGSTRFPGKPLAKLGNKRVLEHVYERCLASKNAEAVFILTDSPEIEDFAKTINAKCIMTSPDCQNGTERIIEALAQIDAEFIVNVQGDEPFIPPSLIDSLFDLHKKSGGEIVTAATPISDPAELPNPNCVKVLTNSAGEILYFSRYPLPYVRGAENFSKWLEQRKYLKHIGIYGYAKSALLKYNTLPQSSLERCESLEQLRFIDAGIKMKLVETDYKVVGIDTPEDLAQAQKMLSSI